MPTPSEGVVSGRDPALRGAFVITCKRQQVQRWKHWRAPGLFGLRPKIPTPTDGGGR
jgi:hypothetical protein